MRLIDADEIDCWQLDDVSEGEAECYIDSLPSVDAKPVVHAHWEPVSKSNNCGYRCSRCKKARISYADYYSTNKRMYCFCCGARMDEVTTNG